MRTYRINLKPHVKQYLDNIAVRVQQTLYEKFNLHPRKSYTMSCSNSLKTFTLQLKHINTFIHQDIVKQKNLLVSAVNAGSDNQPFVGWRGNNITVVAPKPKPFCTRLDYADMVRQRVVSTNGTVTTMGVMPNNQPVNVDISNPDQPHVFYCGRTGGGKSNLQQLQAFNLIRNLKPDDLRVFFIDIEKGFSDWPKQWFNIPHLAAKPILPSNADDAIKLLTWLVNEAQRRFDNGINDAPRLLVVADEYKTLAELGEDIGTKNDNPVSKLFGRLLRIGRSAKINVSLASQDSTIDSLGTRDIKLNTAIKFVGPVANTLTMRNALGTDQPLPMIPKNVGEFVSAINGQLSYLIAPEMFPRFMNSIKYTGQLSPMFSPNMVDTESVASTANRDCPIHDDWQHLADKPAKDIFQVMRRPTISYNYIRTKTDLTNSSNEARMIRDKLLNLREIELDVIQNMLTSGDEIYNPFPGNQDVLTD